MEKNIVSWAVAPLPRISLSPAHPAELKSDGAEASVKFPLKVCPVGFHVQEGSIRVAELRFPG